MWIHQINIHNLKSIEELEIKFDKQITLVYGQNGMGKTTILEAISLLGHLHTMRSIKICSDGKKVVSDSKFFQLSNSVSDENDRMLKEGDGKTDFAETYTGPNSFKRLKSLLSRNYKVTDGLDKWFEGQPLRNDKELSEALIRFEISLSENDKKDDKNHFTFLIYLQNNGDTSITKTLGRKSFDDKKMNDSYALIWEEKGRNKDNIEKLLDHLSISTKYLVPDTQEKEIEKQANDVSGKLSISNTNSTISKNIKQALTEVFSQKQKATNLLKLIKHKNHDGYIDGLNKQNKESDINNLGFTFYLNTDLNDFGRARDVRESVKDIFEDFTDEWIERLGIDFRERKGNSSIKDFGNKDDLEELLNKILNPTLTLLSINKDNFELNECSVKKNENGKWKPVIKVDRYKDKQKDKQKDKDDGVDLDYLSAGENECFFIFMYLLGTNINNSICLLDEPDLHLSQFSKKPFYDSLYLLLARKDKSGKNKNCQIIISTHSGFAYTNPEITKRLYIRKEEGVKEHKTKNSYWFTLALAVLYVKTAAAVLGWTIPLYILLFAGTLSFLSDFFTAFIQTDGNHIFRLQIIVLGAVYFLGIWGVWKCVSYIKSKLSYLE